MKRRTVHAPTLAYLLLIVATTVALQFYHPTGSPAVVAVKSLSAPQKEAIAVTLEMNKLVISLATLVFGAVGTLVFVGDGRIRISGRFQNTLVVATLFFASSALYFSYVTYDKIVEMLSNEFFDLNSELLASPRRLEVDGLTLSVVGLGLLLVTILMPPEGHRDAS